MNQGRFDRLAASLGSRIIPAMFHFSRSVIFGVFGGLAWFVLGILVGKFLL